MDSIFILIAVAVVLYILFRGAKKWVDDYSRRVAEPPAPDAPDGTKVIRDIDYVQTPQGPRSLDIYLPESDSPLPVLLHIHGGGWEIGNKNAVRIYNWQNFAQHGYAVVTIDYRLSGVAIHPAQIHDCKAAVRWIRKNAEQYNFDATRIGVMGSSAGGHLSALIGTSAGIDALEGKLEPGDDQHIGPVQAVVDFAGPSDFSQMEAQRLRFGYKLDARNSIATRFLGGKFSDVPDQVQSVNPINYIKPGMPPFLIVHGEKDHVVPLGQAQILHEALLSSGNESELVIVKDAGHTSVPMFCTDEITEKVKHFLDQHLKLN